MLSQYVNTGQPGRINSFDRYFQVVDRCAARRHRVGYSCACEDTNLTFISPTWGNKSRKHLSLPKCLRKQKPKTSIIAQMSAKAVDSLCARISNR